MAATTPSPNGVQPSPGSSAAVSTASSVTSTSAVPEDQPEKMPDETSKLRLFLSILKKFVGVADIANVRFSLPSQLLEPRPNLEYWTYLDRPETFASIGTADEPLDRMLEVLRFWFTKDLKYVKGKPCKPYNSVLGEFFRCNWEVDELPGAMSSSSKNTMPARKLETPIRVSYLTEQTSHHPPVSAFYLDCPEQGISARGYDQISVKFTGTSVRVAAGEHNYGIFITLGKRDNEQYQLTHPAAYLGGLLRGTLTISVSDCCYVTCPKTKLKTILQYVEDGWLGKAQNRVEGVIFQYDPDKDNITRMKDVPEKLILARISGNWKEKTYYSLGPKVTDAKTLICDLSPLSVAEKRIPPQTQMLSNESLRFWSGLTDAIHAKQFNRATTIKQDLEERQRETARDRQAQGIEWQPRFFTGAVTPVGQPGLSAEGRAVLEKIHVEDWVLPETAPAV